MIHDPTTVEHGLSGYSLSGNTDYLASNFGPFNFPIMSSLRHFNNLTGFFERDFHSLLILLYELLSGSASHAALKVLFYS